VAPEACDDGDAASGDGCDASCALEAGGWACPVAGQACERCGDGTVDANESCDDDNRAGGDGCSADCTTVEPLYSCPALGGACERCGNGNVLAPEVCDDANNLSGDGCRADCRRVETGWDCASGTCYRCGDGVVDSVEVCDDGNAQSGDGCAANCKTIEAHHACPVPGQLCQECGNGAVESSETCDDGNTASDDGCSAGCALEMGGWACPVPGAPCEQCGDSVVDENESCDDGNTASGDGCSSTCTSVEALAHCPPAGGACERCGNGTRVAPEACDDANNVDGDGCRADCSRVESGWGCTTGTCYRCGNGALDPGEVCDDGNAQGGDGCSAACSAIEATFNCPTPGELCQQCGNGARESAEGCDDGDRDGGDGCSSACTLEAGGWLCPLPGQPCERCGDGVATTNEVCDDADTQGGDGCAANCQSVETWYTCPPAGGACTYTVVCGDSRIGDDEACDDGNDDIGDGCDDDCQVESGYYCRRAGVACDPLPACGDGHQSGGEVCDDGNTADDDGCSADCTSVESGYSCPTPGAVCVDTSVSCGDGRLGGTEACDDDNTSGGTLQCQGGTNDQDPCEDDLDCPGSITSGIVHVDTTSFVSAVASVTQSITLQAESENRVLLVGIGVEAAQVQGVPSSIQFDGVPMQLAATSTTATATSAKVHLYYLLDEDLPAASGNYDLSVTLNGLSGGAAYHVIQLDDVEQIAPEPTETAINTAGADAISSTITTLSDRAWVVDLVGTGALLGTAGMIPTAGQTERGDRAASSSTTAIATVEVPTAGSKTLSWSCDGDCNRIAWLAAAFRATSSAALCVSVGGDGCNDSCEIDPGWVCPRPGSPCLAETCGDGIRAGSEECERITTSPAGACNTNCTVNTDYACAPDATSGEQQCVEFASACDNDGSVELGERCDDGNSDSGDGCTPFCEKEPDCSGIGTLAGCTSTCGDGVILASDTSEECDDGNTVSGDGCDDDCQVEAGWACNVASGGTLPDTLEVPVTFRDFLARPTTGNTRHPDFEAFSGSATTPGLVQNQLGSDGKPVFAGICDSASTSGCPFGQQMTTAANFNQWYRNTPGVNIPLVARLPFSKGTGNTYSYIDNSLFPFTGGGWVASGNETASSGNNFGFTSEARYWFEYRVVKCSTSTVTTTCGCSSTAIWR
jgi:cysteine-rich repeat protein